jgi:hypothetical protein
MDLAMATKPREPDWDVEYPHAGASSEPAMPKRAAQLPTQNGPAMRAVFDYLVDDLGPPPPPDPKRRR